MKIGKEQLFIAEELTDMLIKFEDKINKQLEKKYKYEVEIKLLEIKLEKAIEKDKSEKIDEGEITHIRARIANTNTLLNIVDDSIDKIKKIRAERLAEEMAENTDFKKVENMEEAKAE